MARDFYAWVPLELLDTPAVRALRQRDPRAVHMYLELWVRLAASYQHGQHVEAWMARAMAADWGMTADEAGEALDTMAALRLIDQSQYAEGLVGIAEVADRAQFLEQKAEAGRRSGESRRGKGGRKKQADEQGSNKNANTF